MRPAASTPRLLFACLCAITLLTGPAHSDNAGVSGKWLTIDGEPFSNVPITIVGTTSRGDEISTFSVTDEDGEFRIHNLPAGQYQAIPAWDHDAAVPFSVADQPWYRPWAKAEAVDLGEVTVNIESTELPDAPADPPGAATGDDGSRNDP